MKLYVNEHKCVNSKRKVSSLLSSPFSICLKSWLLSNIFLMFLLICIIYSAQSVQLSLSLVPLFSTPWTAARQASLSITNSQSLLRLMSIKSVMPSNHLMLCHPLFILPSISPSIRVFSNDLRHLKKIFLMFYFWSTKYIPHWTILIFTPLSRWPVAFWILFKLEVESRVCESPDPTAVLTEEAATSGVDPSVPRHLTLQPLRGDLCSSPSIRTGANTKSSASPEGLPPSLQRWGGVPEAACLPAPAWDFLFLTSARRPSPQKAPNSAPALVPCCGPAMDFIALPTSQSSHMVRPSQCLSETLQQEPCNRPRPGLHRGLFTQQPSGAPQEPDRSSYKAPPAAASPPALALFFPLLSPQSPCSASQSSGYFLVCQSRALRPPCFSGGWLPLSHQSLLLVRTNDTSVQQSGLTPSPGARAPTLTLLIPPFGSTFCPGAQHLHSSVIHSCILSVFLILQKQESLLFSYMS